MLTALTKNCNKQVRTAVDDFRVRSEVWVGIHHAKNLDDTLHPFEASKRLFDERQKV